jgi:hypothetical protein
MPGSKAFIWLIAGFDFLPFLVCRAPEGLADQNEKLFERWFYRREFFSFPSIPRSAEYRVAAH